MKKVYILSLIVLSVVIPTTAHAQNNPGGVWAIRLIDASSNDVIMPLEDDGVVAISELPGEIVTIDALTWGDPQSVAFKINKLRKVDNGPVFAALGDSSDNYNGVQIRARTFTLSATPYSGENGAGRAGRTMTVRVTVVEEGPGPASIDFPDFAACEPAYSADSLWNTPVNWDEVAFHPNSDNMIDHFFDGSGPAQGWVGSDPTQYKTPIYEVTSDEPLVVVQLENSYRDTVQVRNGTLVEDLDTRANGGVVWLPIPADARPAPGTDSTLVVVVTDTGFEYGIREAKKITDQIWTASAAYEYHIGFDGVPPKNFQFRGPDATLLGGGVRRCEIEEVGAINHALNLSYDYPASCSAAAQNGWPCWIPPFTDSDGRSNHRWAIPEGARIVINPDISQAQIEDKCNGHTGCILWVQAMQTYGGFVMDNSGRPSTYIDAQHTANWTEELFKERALEDLPQSWFEVLDWDTENR